MTEECFQMPMGPKLAGVGHEGAGSDHFHGEFISGKDPKGESIDGRGLLASLKIDSKVVIPGQGGHEEKLTWDKTAQEWFYGPINIFYHRNLDGTEHYLAGTTGKEEIEYKKVKFIDDNGLLQDKETWVSIVDQNLRWNGNKFVPRLSI